MDNCITVTLPVGWWHEGICYKDAQLRALTGVDLSFLVEAGESLSPGQRAIAIITRALARLGPFASISTELLQAITVGDRDALLLQLRALMFGERMQCMLVCPNQNCGEKMELELNTSDLVLPAQPPQQPTHELSLREDEKVYCVTVRLPNIGDLETVRPLARSDPEAATVLLLERCVERMSVAGSDQPVASMPSGLIAQLSAAFAELDPQAEMTLSLTCPNCECHFTGLLDTTSFIYEELKAHLSSLYKETHLLAFHYHWSEAEIMNMSVNKRRRYLSLLEAELTQGAGV